MSTTAVAMPGDANYPNGYPVYANGYVVEPRRTQAGEIVWLGIGPAAPPSMTCAECGQLSLCECQGCHGAFCVRHWWKHSHAN